MAMDSRRSHSTHAEHAGTLSSEMPPAPPSSSAATPSTSAAPSATSVSSSLPSTSSRSVDDEPPHMKRISRGVSLRGDVSRVHQLDAERFDTQVFSLLKEQYLKIFHLFDRTLVSQYQPEIEALLSLLVFRYSIWKSDRTYGHQMMNLRYQSARSPSTLGLSRWQRSLYGLITIGGGWLLKRLNRMTETHWESADEDTRVFLDRLWKCLRIGERVHSVLSIVSLLVFLYDSRYPTLLSRLLSMRLVYAKRTQARFRNFDFLNRQLLWQYFSEFIFFLVTLLGSGNVLGRVKKHIVDAFSQQQQQQQQQQHSVGHVDDLYDSSSSSSSSGNSSTSGPCSLCGVSSANTPHWPDACNHIYCYYCLSVALLRDPDYRCVVCGLRAEGLRRPQTT